MRKIILILICLASIEGSFACINEYRTLLTGEVVYINPSSGKVWNSEIDTLELRMKSDELLDAYKRSDSLEYYSDYAAALTYLGEYQKAKKIYEQIERLKPNLERNSYSILPTDTLEFRDDTMVYRVIEVKLQRADTTTKSDSATYNFKTDKVSKTLTYPVYPEKLKKLRIPVIDTIYDPSDPAKYRVQKTDSINIEFAKSYPLNPTSFFQTIRKIEKMAEFQGLEIATIVPNFYGSTRKGIAIELIESKDFEDLDFATVNFLFKKGDLMMDYPILFEHEEEN